MAAAVVVLLVLPSPVRSSMPRVAARRRRRGARSSLLVVPLAVPCSASDLRALVTRGSLPGVVLLSVLAVVGHVAVFLVAARTAGVDASPARLLPLALLVLLAMAVPANVAGWGPREGVAAWAFGAAGLGASAGVETAVVYGVLVLVASLPGVAVLVVETVAGAPRTACPSPSWRWPMADRPYTLLSCGMSLDAYLDGPGEDRVLFSNDADFDRVDAVRAECDAILVGRRDGPQGRPAAAGPRSPVRGGRSGWPAACAPRR